MTPLNRLLRTHVTLTEEEAVQLRHSSRPGYTVEVHPPRDGDLPATLDTFVRGIQELQTKWLGLRNASPVIAFEIRRLTPDTLRYLYTVPTKRLERKLRTQLHNQVAGVDFATATDELPVAAGNSIGGGLLTTGRRDWYPLRREFDRPPANALAAALHRHAIPDTRVVVQVLFQPVIGRPVRSWWWTRRAYQRVGYLRKEKDHRWYSRPATPRERKQADAIEQKAGTPRFRTSIRLLVLGGGEYTPSRIKELAGAFNVFENSDTGQYLDTSTVTAVRRARILNFAKTVRNRRFAGWSLAFQASLDELAALVSLPDRTQQNIQYATP